MTSVYLSGPMTGQEGHGFAAFFAAAADLRAEGLTVVSPAEMSIERVERLMASADLPELGPGKVTWATFSEAPDLYYEVLSRIPRETLLRADAIALLGCDSVAVLPGWETSEGAHWEVGIAKGAGLSVWKYPTGDLVDALDMGAAKMKLAGAQLRRQVSDAEVRHERLTEGPPMVDYEDRTPAGIYGRIIDQQEEYGSGRLVDRGAVVVSPTGAQKADGGKPRMDLLPYLPALETARVLTLGAERYGAWNWRKGFEWSRIYSSLQRHLGAWNNGEDLDPDTNISHLAHARCCLDFLLQFALTGTGIDDRYKPEAT